MRRLSILTVCLALLAVAACSSSSGDGDSGGAEIRSEQDAQQLFETIMPDLIAAFTEVANSQTAASQKQGGTSTIPCPQGGSLIVDPVSGMATLSECGVNGVLINGSLFLSVVPFSDGTYQAAFSGPLTVSGTFNGMLEVLDSLIEWRDPPSVDTTFWSVTVYIPAFNQSFTVTSGNTIDPNERCVEACDAIQAACASAESDCVTDCSSDVAECPAAMGSVIDCVLANRNQLQCDPDQDQGLAEAPCEAQHAAVQAPECDKDPF